MSNEETALATIPTCRACKGTGAVVEGFPKRERPCRRCRGSRLDYEHAFEGAEIEMNLALRKGYVDPVTTARTAARLAAFAILQDVKRYAKTAANDWFEGETDHEDASDHAWQAADDSALTIYSSDLVAMLATDDDRAEAKDLGIGESDDPETMLAFIVLLRHIQEAIDAGEEEREGVEAAAKAGSHAGRLDAIMDTADAAKPSGSIFYVIAYPARAGVEALGPRMGEYGRTHAEALASLRAKVSDALRGVEA